MYCYSRREQLDVDKHCQGHVDATAVYNKVPHDFLISKLGVDFTIIKGSYLIIKMLQQVICCFLRTVT